MSSITTACLDMAGTTVADEGSVMAAFIAAVGEFGLVPGAPGYDEAMTVVHATMGQSKIEVFRRILGGERDGERGGGLGGEEQAQQANRAFEMAYADAVQAGQVTPLPGAEETIKALRQAGIRVCLATGFAPPTRDALLDALGWWPLIDPSRAELEQAGAPHVLDSVAGLLPLLGI